MSHVPTMPSTHRLLAALCAGLAWAACGGPSEPQLPPELSFSATMLELGPLREGEVDIRNLGGQSIGPVEMISVAVQDLAGATVPGVHITSDPAEVPTLNPGDTRTIHLGITNEASLQPGFYDAVLVASGGVGPCEVHWLGSCLRGISAQLTIHFTVLSAEEEAAAILTLSTSTTEIRTGDVVGLAVEVRDDAGELVQGAPVTWTLNPATAGFVGATGQFVAYESGTVTITAQVGDAEDAVTFNVSERGLRGAFTTVGRARETLRFTSDLWLHGDVAYSGTWGSRQVGDSVRLGNMLNVWDIADPTSPTLSSTLELDARTVNDVKVREDGTLAIATHEGSANGLNGITILDLTDPLEPEVVGRFTDELQSGVHNVWIDGDYASLVVDGIGNGLRILDISDPSLPTVAARFWAGESFLHDVYVRDGLAFLSHWNAGLIILDVGHGIAGGTPSAPVEVARLSDLSGQTHNAWYWPEAGYVFVGEEDFSAPGVMHVVDVRNLREPREVATYEIRDQPPHNFWLDEAQSTLYLAWYGQGLRALDVSGDLMGQLDRQGREITRALYNFGFGECDRSTAFTCSWAPQLHQGLLWVSDMNEGLIALEPPR